MRQVRQLELPLQIPLPARFDVHRQHIQQEVARAGIVLIRLVKQVFQARLDGRQGEEAGERRNEQVFVFTNEVGGPLERRNLAHMHLHKILEEARLPRIRFYHLRHTPATLALSAGVPVKEVSEMPGCPGVALTLGVYSHVLPYMQEDAARRMAALLEYGGDDDGAKRHIMGAEAAKSRKWNVA